MWSIALFCLVVAPHVISENSDEVAGRILGGLEALIEKYPYQVFYSYHSNKTQKIQYCDGFIISENYIVTVAHCLEYATVSSIVVGAGSTYRNDAAIIPIANFTIHPRYNKGSPMKNDVAVLKTVNPIQFNETIQPIQLAKAKRVLKDYSNITLSGWGALGDGNPPSNRLLAVNLKVVPFSLCTTYYGLLRSNNFFCASGSTKPREGACEGDDGGAAVQDGVAVGIASLWSCGDIPYPTVFVSIAYSDIREFIKKERGI